MAAFRQPSCYPAGHYHSPVSSGADIRRALARLDSQPHGVDLGEAEQLALADTLDIRPEWRRYVPDNNMFGQPDAALYQALLRKHTPARIIETGSGYSTVVALDTLPEVDLTCIEPNPQRLRSLIRPGDRVTIMESGAQHVPVETYLALEAGDVLFIDSTHVAKAGSDVVYLVLDVLPRLASGVIVHVHDCFWPFEYPDVWLEERRDWTELYLMHAFLIGNADWQVLLFGNWLWRQRPDLRKMVPGPDPSGLWLVKR
ncbi:class I SAM-dependent methyltransferase [Dactylosporangium fulvum]